MRGLFAEALNGHDVDALGRYCAVDYCWHGSGRDVEGLPAFKVALTEFFDAFPDVHAKIDDLVEGSDRIAVRYTESGTQRGTFMGIEPAGAAVEWQGIAIYRAADGLLVEEWSVTDTHSLLRQLGHAPRADEES